MQPACSQRGRNISVTGERLEPHTHGYTLHTAHIGKTDEHTWSCTTRRRDAITDLLPRGPDAGRVINNKKQAENNEGFWITADFSRAVIPLSVADMKMCLFTEAHAS